MKHKPKDVRIHGANLRQCRRCEIVWPLHLEQAMMVAKCPGRN